MVVKTVAYERTPYVDDPTWPASGSLCQRDDNDDGDWIYYADTWFMYDLMQDAGFTTIDTLFSRNAVSYDDTWPAWSAGRGFIHYRGQAMFFWISPFDIPVHHEYGIRNGLEVLDCRVSPPAGPARTTSTGSWPRTGQVGLTGGEPHGAVAFFATSTAFEGSEKLSLKRSSVGYGILRERVRGGCADHR